MSDYIKREDVLEIVAHNNVNGEITLNRYDKIIDGIYDIPSADVEEVVRCKDCLWFEIAVMKADGTPDKRYKRDWCGLHRIVMDGDDYCSGGWKDEG